MKHRYEDIKEIKAYEIECSAYTKMQEACAYVARGNLYVAGASHIFDDTSTVLEFILDNAYDVLNLLFNDESNVQAAKELLITTEEKERKKK